MRILLLGAGFTRNWGGLLASEFMGELSGELVDRPRLSTALRSDGNFERVYGERVTATRLNSSDSEAAEDVVWLDKAISRVFRNINLSLVDRPFNFSNDVRCSMQRFLSRFHAIYTLNQDLLFELHYDGMFLASVQPKWDGHYFPGVSPTHAWNTTPFTKDRVDVLLTVASSVGVREPRLQPIYKLHGSSNWRGPKGDPVLVIGTGKEETIAGSSLLRRYAEIFREDLFRGNTEIMVIGYSFSDTHVNSSLLEAARNHGLKMYLVNPSGTLSYEAHPGRSADGPNELLEIPLLGECKRPLSEVFRDYEDPLMRSVEKFFQR